MIMSMIFFGGTIKRFPKGVESASIIARIMNMCWYVRFTLNTTWRNGYRVTAVSKILTHGSGQTDTKAYGNLRHISTAMAQRSSSFSCTYPRTNKENASWTALKTATKTGNFHRETSLTGHRGTNICALLKKLLLQL